MTLAAQASADIIMVCDAYDNEKRYYKLKQSFLGNNIVEQKKDGKWVDWHKDKEEPAFLVSGDVYDSGATMVSAFYQTWDKDYTADGVVAGKEYYIETSYILDFEFGIRKVEVNVYENNSKAQELKNHNYNKTYSDEYTCEIQG